MFKLVSLHVIDTMASSQRRPAPPVLWKSGIPRDESHRPLYAELSKDPLSLSFFLMHLRILFGGKDGSRLSSLSRLTGLLDGAIGLHGLIFAYEDKTELLYGARVSPRCAGPERICVEQSFLIDGPGGERIVEITYSSRTGSDALRIGYPGISALEVSVSHWQYWLGMLTDMTRSSQTSTAVTRSALSTTTATSECRCTDAPSEALLPDNVPRRSLSGSGYVRYVYSS
jgi:hypothetical protein